MDDRLDHHTCIFPTLTDGYIRDCNSGTQSDHHVDLTHLSRVLTAGFPAKARKVSPQAIIVGAWAITAAKYIGTDHVSFHVILNSAFRRDALVCDLFIDESETQLEFLCRVEDLVGDGSPQAVRLDELGTAETCAGFLGNFSNLCLVYEDGSGIAAPPLIDHVRKQGVGLLLNFSIAGENADAHLSYADSLLSDGQATNVAATLAKVLTGLLHEPGRLIGDVDFMSEAHLDRIWSFNRDVPAPWLECFHDVVQRHANDAPDRLALDAWDAKLTYSQLTGLASHLARWLQDNGVGPGTVVPLCFERSAWAVVAMLAVSKAGGAFVSIPPSLPPGRRDQITEQTEPVVVLTTSDHGNLWEGRARWIAIEGEQIGNLAANGAPPPSPLAGPEDMFYLIFTSGSTGRPKGVVVSHSSFLSGALKRAPEWGFGPESRVLQMLSHTFDMSLLEICTTLGSGGCVCVPTAEEIDNGLASVINSYRVNHAVMTPSLARNLEPSAVPGLKTMCLGGEAFPREIVTTWAERINLCQFYGPSECSINSSTRRITSKDADPLNIGPANCAACWVVVPGDHDKLVPIGAVGELVVSGPIVGLGYFKDPERTSKVFIGHGGFASHDPVFRNLRYYKTGDLVRWNSDGSLTFCGRADTQVKLNGQRLELGEVEYHLALDDHVSLAMALVPKAGPCLNRLVAVITPRLEAEMDGGQDGTGQNIRLLSPRLDPAIAQVIKDLRLRLQEALPRYMVPAVWAFVARMPLSASGKIDRVTLRRWVEEMDDATFSEVTGSRPDEPDDHLEVTPRGLEHQIRQIWAVVLDQPEQRVGLHKPFIFLGGDSILAMEVVARCRKEGIKTTVMDTLSARGVAEAASSATSVAEAKPALDPDSATRREVPGFGQTPPGIDVANWGDVEDVYPCTSMQEGMLVGSIRKPGAYHLRFFFRVVPRDGAARPGLEAVEAAWRAVVARHPSLRTVFVEGPLADSDCQYHSVVLRQPAVDLCVRQIPAGTTGPEATKMFTDTLIPFKRNSPLHRLTVCLVDSEVAYMMMEISHTILDGAALEVLLREFALAYAGKLPAGRGPAYRDFAAYKLSLETQGSAQYWARYLRDAVPCMLPVGKEAPAPDPTRVRLLRRDFDYERSREFLAMCRQRSLTVACAIRAAWALVLRTYAGAEDVCFGYVSAGRDVPVKDVNRMVGVCLSMQPCRVRLTKEATLVSIATAIQREYIEGIPHHHFSFSKMRTGSKGQAAQLFNTAISMEWMPKTDLYAGSQIALEELRPQDDATEYDLAISIDVLENHIRFGFLYWPELTEFELTHLAVAFKEAMSCLLDSPDAPIASLSLAGRAGRAGLPMVASQVETTTLPERIRRNATARPEAEALVSWDGAYSYAQLDRLSSALAGAFVARGVQRGDRVLVCQKKSCWAIITMLAVARSGAAFVAADASQPARRIKALASHCRPSLVVADAEHATRFAGLGAEVVTGDQLQAETNGASSESDALPAVGPKDVFTIVYTSGSTGEPKGIVLDHGALSASVLSGHGKTLEFSSGTRAFQFASFTFDCALMEIFTTLAHGGCVCVPSEEERSSDLAGCVSRLRANWACFTPSTLRLMRPEEVPCLKTIVVVGEAMSQQDLRTWTESVRLYNGYGPAETTILISSRGPLGTSDDSRDIGYAFAGTRLWVTEMASHERLVPPGCVGELVVESRQVASGYWNDPEQTAKSFIEDPVWLPQIGSPSGDQQGRRTLYKTGDLVKYGPDGSLLFLGRKDGQVKLHGRRLELQEIELCVRECLPEVSGVAVEIIASEGRDGRPTLAAFLSGPECNGMASPRAESIATESASGAAPPDDLRISPVSLPARVREQLAEGLPRYMIPMLFLAASTWPVTVSGKTDRGRLREAGRRFLVEELARTKSTHVEGLGAPSSETERNLRRLWADALGMEPEAIRVDENFFHLGGDSVAVMRLAAEARRMGMALSASDVFLHPTIAKQAVIVLDVGMATNDEAPGPGRRGDAAPKMPRKTEHDAGLAEVERQVAVHFDGASLVLAELVQTFTASRAYVLAVLILPHGEEGRWKPGAGALFGSPQASFQSKVEGVYRALQRVLPAHLLPSIWLPLSGAPRTETGEVDRQRLREELTTLPPGQLEACSVTPVQENERGVTKRLLLQHIWACGLLGLSDRPGLDGKSQPSGPSDPGAEPTVKARRAEYGPCVADALAVLVLGMLAPAAVPPAPEPPAAPSGPAPFSLLTGDESERLSLVRLAAEQCRVPREHIEDMYPCTPLQEGMVLLSAKTPRAYAATFAYALPAAVDPDRFSAAWDATVRAHAILRTRIIQTDSQASLQVVLCKPPPMMELELGQEKSLPDLAADMGRPGAPMFQMGLVKPDADSTPRLFVMAIHHALYDAWSLRLLLHQVDATYRGSPVQETPAFSRLIAFQVSTQQAAAEYWKEELTDSSEAAAFPLLPYPEHGLDTSSSMTQTVQLERATRNDGITMATKLKLAWSVTASLHSGTNHVVFGVTTSGRGAPILGIDRIVGPAIATTPMVVRLEPSQALAALLEAIQIKSARAMQHEHIGMQNISRLGPSAAAACRFQTHMVIQPEAAATAPALFSEQEQALSDSGAFGTYALVLICTASQGSVEIEAMFDCRVLEHSQVRRILVQFQHVLTQIHTRPEATLSELDLLPPEDWKQLCRWNPPPPARTQASCVHDLIHLRSLDQPDAAAIRAWDGALSYRELDQLSSTVAANLRRLGVGPEDFVPLFFGKSRWAVVAQVAVMKAGGAFVLLSPATPPTRLKEILDSILPRVVVSSTEASELAQGFGLGVVTIREADLVQPNAQSDASSLPPLSMGPSNALCAIFTSGSTGKPKATVLEHGSFCSSAEEHIGRLGLTSRSRVLQFSGYEFDACIVEHLSTLIAGGCICIPSESDRMSRLPEVAAELQVNWALLTPPVARLLSPHQLPELRTLVIGGEAMDRSDVELWSRRVRLMNAYGPSECTILTSIQDSVTPSTSHRDIGRPLACACWVVDREDPERILPIGSVGELLVEGPIVSRGYLNEPAKTAASFTEAPGWLRRLRGGSAARVYRTGDLVRYQPSGSLFYIGRKDTQAKLRGQRTELSEVEHHVRHSFPGVRNIVAEVVAHDHGSSQMLVAFVCLTAPVAGTYLQEEVLLPPTSLFLTKAHTAAERMGGRVPAHMIPTVFIPLRVMPLTKSGKVDRRRLREAAAALTPLQLRAYMSASRDEVKGPSTDKEDRLRQIWAWALDTDPDSIGTNENLFRIGGDSITAMRIASRCSSTGLAVTVGDIVRQKTIANIARQMETGESDPTHAWFALSPIQQLLFGATPTSDGRYGLDQCFFICLEPEHDSDRVSSALESVVHRHAALRSRFRKSSQGEWEQGVLESARNSYRLKTHHLGSGADIRVALESSSKSLDIFRGPLIAADLVVVGRGRFLFLVAHRLVVDSTSSRIIIEDLNGLLRLGSAVGNPRPTFQGWCQRERGTIAQEEAPLLPLPPSILHGLVELAAGTRPNGTSGGTGPLGFVLSEGTTGLLLGAANRAFRTQPVDILYAALLHSFAKTFPDQTPPAIFVGVDGRHASLHPGLPDSSHTVGCFTTLVAPRTHPDARGSIAESVRRAKDTLRHAAANPRHRLEQQGQMDVFLDPLDLPRGPEPEPEPGRGQLGPLTGVEQLEQLEQLWQPDQAAAGLVVGGRRQLALIDVSMSIYGGSLRCNFRVGPQHMQDAPAIRQWIGGYEASLTEAAEELASLRPSYTPSDFPLLTFSDHRLEEVLGRIMPQLGLADSDIEDMYPCSPVQRGILISRAKDPLNYSASLLFTATPAEGCPPVELDRLRCAWQSVVDRHAILRTLFVDVSGQGSLDQVVLRHAEVDFETDSGRATDADADVELGGAHTPRTKTGHKLVVRRTSAGALTCELQISHALYDGVSGATIQRDLVLAYDGRLPTQPSPQYKDYVAYTQALDQTLAREYWGRYLEGAEPCLLPTINDANDADASGRRVCKSVTVELGEESLLNDFCRQHGVLHSAVFHLAELTLLSALLQSGEDFANGLLHQHHPLLDIQHSKHLSGESIFNTVLSLRDGAQHQPAEGGTMVLEFTGGQNITEYDMAVEVVTTREGVHAELTYQAHLLSDERAAAVAQAFRQALVQVTRDPAIEVGQVGLPSADDLGQILQWNRQPPPPAVEQCIHDIIHKASLAEPDLPAVCSWDRDLTRGELDRLSWRLARHLVDLGVHAEAFVPIFLERSCWTVVAILGVLKAGAAFVLLDSSTTPPQRLREICQDVEARIVITSARNADRIASIVVQTVEVDEGKASAWPDDGRIESLPSVALGQAAYVIFTSGTTGRAKGAIIEHRALVTSAKGHSAAISLSSRSRVLQFASYAFDATILEILTTLFVGGCVCIPSDRERESALPVAIARMGINWALLTPSVARTIEPDTVSGLETLVLGGESLSPMDIRSWHGAVRLILAYGPAECTITCAATKPRQLLDDARILGSFVGCVPWIAVPSDSNTLAPIGTVGELLIEGPILSRGYVNDPARTAAAFIDFPPWLRELRGHEERGKKIYRTGDLVRYAPDGSICFVGRMDGQVKLRGQRIEISDVEHHTQHAFPDAKTVIAEVIAASGGESAASLVAFIWQGQKMTGREEEPKDQPRTTGEGLFPAPSDEFRSQVALAESRLCASLPSYMRPAAFLPISYLPLTGSGKADRRLLRRQVGLLSREEIHRYRSLQAAKRAPLSEMEARVQGLVARVLRLPVASVGLDDDFFGLGGDSITAMMLAAQARRSGIELSVPTVFTHPKLSDIAIVAQDIASDDGTGQSEPQRRTHHGRFGAGSGAVDVAQIATRWSIPADSVVDVLPTTQFQRQYIRVQQSNYFILTIPGQLDRERLRASIKAVVEKYSILRTVFVPHDKTFVQVILRQIDAAALELQADGELASHVRSVCQRDSAVTVPFGTPHFRPMLISRDESLHALVFRLSHAQYDGVSLPLLYMDLAAAYNAVPLSPTTGDFSDYLASRALEKNSSRAIQFWTQLLQGSSMTHLPSPSAAPGHRPTASSAAGYIINVTRIIPSPSPPPGATLATLHKTAWSLVLARRTGARDLVFGQVANGRSSSPGHEHLLGPCIHIIPVRVTLQDDWTVLDLLRQVQHQHASTLPFETVDLEDIVLQSTDWQPDTNYGSVVEHQNFAPASDLCLGDIRCTIDGYTPGHMPTSIFSSSLPQGADLAVSIISPNHMLDSADASVILDELCDTLAVISNDVHGSVCERL
ncbi:hypothetical protein RB596_007520 [Gaeumannomyces avenae]